MEGTFFERAYVTNSMCCPSRSTALTGRYSHNHGVLSNKTRGGVRGGFGAYKNLGTGAHNLGVWLQEEGYATSLYGKFMNGYGRGNDRPPGGFDRFYTSDEGREDPDLGRKAAGWIADHHRRPMFLALWLRSPHAPFRAAEPYRATHRDDEIDPGPAYAEADVSDKHPWVRAQEAKSRRAITGMGRERLRMLEGSAAAMARVRDAMGRWGEQDDTYYVFLSDNGYQFGEHGLKNKALPYEESVHVPMFVSGPEVAAGARRTELVANNDIAPTVLEWAGAEATRPMDGRSLTPLLSGGPTPAGWRTALLSESPGMNAKPGHKLVRTEDHAYVEWEGGFKEMYDTNADPHQLDGTVSREEEVAAGYLAARLDALEDCEGESCRTAEEAGTVP
jgi:N-acetylglucosamine-6-sulfatase